MTKTKKTPTTSEEIVTGVVNKGGGLGNKTKHVVKRQGKSKTFVREYPGQDMGVDFHNDPKPDYEAALPEPDDEFAHHQYPPPKKHPTFRKVWGQFIDSLVSRENFKVGHLNNLEILCDLYVEYEDLQKFVRERGRSYLSVGRGGETWKFYPEVKQLTSVQNNIKSYTAMLGLVPKKDHTPDSGDKEESWD